MTPNAPARRTLADIIMEKLTEKQTEVASQMSGEESRTVMYFFVLFIFVFDFALVIVLAGKCDRLVFLEPTCHSAMYI